MLKKVGRRRIWESRRGTGTRGSAGGGIGGKMMTGVVVCDGCGFFLAMLGKHN